MIKVLFWTFDMIFGSRVQAHWTVNTSHSSKKFANFLCQCHELFSTHIANSLLKCQTLFANFRKTFFEQFFLVSPGCFTKWQFKLPFLLIESPWSIDHVFYLGLPMFLLDNILCLLVGEECPLWKLAFSSLRLWKFHCTMNFIKKNAVLVAEVGVDDQGHDDELKGFREWLQGISLCYL